MRKPILTVIVGLLAGFFNGALGISSAPLLLPAVLFFSLVDNYKTAIGTVILTIVAPLSIFAVVRYYNKGYVKVKTALLLMAAVALGTYFGSVFTTTVGTPITLAYMTASVLMLVSLFWFYLAYMHGDKFIELGSNGSSGKRGRAIDRSLTTATRD